MSAVVAPSQLRLELVCRCVATLDRQGPEGQLTIARFERADSCQAHAAAPAIGTKVVGFGPYPVWSADRALRVESVPEAGGLMEGEHAFVLDEQFCFLAAEPAPKAIGPIRDAAWKASAAASH